jgi:hypothetical protein
MSEDDILNIYWPVIEEAINVQEYYKTRICPDVTGKMLEELTKARKACPVKREEI